MVSKKTSMLLDDFLMNCCKISQEEREEIMDKINLQIADYPLDGEVTKIEKIKKTQIMISVILDKPLTKTFKGMSDEKHKELINNYNKLHMGKIELCQK